MIDLSREKTTTPFKVLSLPNKAQFRAWRLSLRSAVASAYADSDAAFTWILEVENVDGTFEGFSGMPDARFLRLDSLLGAGWRAVVIGDVGREITLKSEVEAKLGRLIKGRQILWLVHEYYHSRSTAGSLYDYEDLLVVTLKHESNLRPFMRNCHRPKEGT